MNTKRNIIFSFACILVLIIIFGIWYYIDQKNIAYKEIYLEFKTPEDSYEVDDKLDPLSFIKKTNVKDVEYPEINPKSIGDHTYVYVAKDGWGNRKEYILKLNFVDPIKPVLALSTDFIEVYEGEEIDFNSYVLEAYDEIDGKLDVEIDVPEDLQVGEYEIKYTVTDKHKNIVSSILHLKINSKPIEKPVEGNLNSNSNTSNQNNNKPLNNSNSSSSSNSFNNSDSSNTNKNNSVSLPSSKIFTFDEYGSIANAEAKAKAYGDSNCPSGHSWSCNPYSNDAGYVIGYVVTFK
ncbi:MAG: hypothetical protein K2P09_03200 [Erysipelotrichales bacterium]|uniref:hypothetical protein n=1 Tax=Thomasclavelia cocleata TaxID=69824 RepID=UPI0023C42BE1|nr:hypothetical protein [Thomasclavelia cocleata]MDE6952799.1 hypothetical protein [Erysipelotrichales bacterium]